MICVKNDKLIEANIYVYIMEDDMGNFRKFISLLLVFVLVLSLCPAGFAAEDVDGAEILEEAALTEPDIIETEPGETESEELPPEPEEPEEVTEEPSEEPAETEDGEEAGENEAEESEEEEKTKEESEEEKEEKSEEEEEGEKLFPGMPEGYVLSADEMAAKQALDANGVVEALAEAVPGVDYVDGEVFFVADTPEYAQLVADAYGAVLAEYAGGVAVLTLNGASVLDAVAAAADMNNNMPVVEANYICEMIPEPDMGLDGASTYAYRDENGVSVKGSWKAWYESTANPDTYMSQPNSWTYQYMHDVVNTYEAWGVTKGAGVTVAVVDSGVDMHEDLNNNVKVRQSVKDWGALGSDHGTHVAGIVAAQMGNGIGGAGIAPEAKIYSERVFQGGGGSTADIIQGINNVIAAKAADPSIKVMNMSLGGYFYSSQYEAVIRKAIAAGITVVVAMGNDGSNIQCYPAAFNIPGLVAVQSSTAANTLSPFSNYGPWADVTAPGSNIMSTVFGNAYETHGGTSMAAPVVSGVCALYLSVNPTATPAQVETAIKKATNKGIVDASKLFNTENKAPVITPEELKAKDGSLPYGSMLTISAADSSETIIYTVGGKIPSIKNGVVTGTVADGGTAWIPLIADNGFAVGKSVVVRAAAVNGLGMVSRVTSLTVKVGYAEATGVEITDYPQKLISGKSYTLTAKVLPAEANQKVIWEMPEDKMNGDFRGTSIDSRGVLKTGAKDEGTVTVYARAADDPNIKSLGVEIKVAPLHPTRRIELYDEDGQRTKNLTLYVNSAAQSQPVQLSAVSYKASDIKTPVYDDTYVWKSSNTKVVTVNETGLVSVTGRGSAVITCAAKDGTNVKTSIPVKVFSCADALTISGLSTVAAGKTVTYTAGLLPKTANFRTVTWGVSFENSGEIEKRFHITIDQRGRVTVPKNTPITEFKIWVCSGLSAYAEKTVRVSSEIAQIKLMISDVGFSGRWKTGRDYSLMEATLFATDAFDTGSWYYSHVNLKPTRSPLPCEVEWTSSNPKVAVVDENGLVTAVAPGKAKITCKATDAGRKSHSVSIIVVNPASSVNVVSKEASFYETGTLASGKSVRSTVVLGDAHGVPTIKKVDWEYAVIAFDKLDGSYVDDFSKFAWEKKLFTMNRTTGQLTASRNAYNVLKSNCDLDDEYNFTVYAVAYTTDGTNMSGSVGYNLAAAPISKLLVEHNGKNYTNLKLPGYMTRQKGSTLLPVLCQRTDGKIYSFSDWTVKSSNPNIVGAAMTYDKAGNPQVAVIAGQRAGSAVITLTSSDGSNKKVTITVRVK